MTDRAHFIIDVVFATVDAATTGFLVATALGLTLAPATAGILAVAGGLSTIALVKNLLRMRRRMRGTR